MWDWQSGGLARGAGAHGSRSESVGKGTRPKEAERIQSQKVPGLGGRIRHCFCTVSGKPRGGWHQAAVRTGNEGLNFILRSKWQLEQNNFVLQLRPTPTTVETSAIRFS